MKEHSYFLNRSSRRKRGIASNPLFILPDLFLHFLNLLSYGYLRFEGMFPFPSNLRQSLLSSFEKYKENLVFHFGGGRHASLPVGP